MLEPARKTIKIDKNNYEQFDRTETVGKARLDATSSAFESQRKLRQCHSSLNRVIKRPAENCEEIKLTALNWLSKS